MAISSVMVMIAAAAASAQASGSAETGKGWPTSPDARIVARSAVRESTAYEYDELHRLTRVTYPNGLRMTYEYDAVGNRVSQLVVLMR